VTVTANMVRVDAVALERRESVDPSTLPGEVLHWSIPNLDDTGGPVAEPAATIGSAKIRLVGGEVLISRLNPRKARVICVPHLVTGQHLCSSEFVVLQPHGVEQRFLWYVLSSEATRQLLDASVQSVTRSHQRVRPELVTHLKIPLPAPEQQRRIADFLDAETARIDALITAKQQMIELLAIERSASTFAAVSGLLGSHEHRAATVPWLETVPTHWREAKLTLLASLGSGHTPSRSRPDWWTDCTIPWITTGEVAQMRSDEIEYLTETREMISELGLTNSSAVVHPAGTVVLCRTASAGYSAIMGSDMAVSQDFATWTCGPKLRPRFLLLCLRSMRRDLLERLATGSTHKTIYMPDIEGLRIPVPPLAEQDEIVERSWQRFRSVDSANTALTRQIVLLRERRQALITAAVTGELAI